MTMSKQNFELIASVVRSLPRGENGGPWAFGQAEEVARRFADELAITNPRFNRERFMAACRGEDSRDSAGRLVRYGG